MTTARHNHQHDSRDDLETNPNSLHDYHRNKRGPKGVPKFVMASRNSISKPKDPGHEYAKTEHIFFEYFDQRSSNAPFGYEHYVSLPPGYETEPEKRWPLVLFLHGAGESQRNANESYLSIRHGIPKVILCYDRVKSGKEPVISIPMANRLRKTKQAKQGDLSETAVPPEVCTLLAENFMTVSPSLNMECGYGWNASILSALLDEIVERYRVDMHRIHVTGFSMSGYGTWELALHTPKRFASAMPICGGGDHLRASILKQIPHWIHHGDKDDIIPLQASQQMVDALERAGAEEIQFTRYPELMHDSWTAAYNSPEVYRWMLDRRRQVQGDERVVPDANKTTVA